MSEAEIRSLFQPIVDGVSDAIVFADPRGVIRWWNPGAEALFGFSVEEALGKSLDLIIPERLRAAHWKAFDRAIETGATKYGRQALLTRALHKDGRKLYVDLSFAVIRDASGEVAGSAAVARDATQRYESEQSLRKRLAELESQARKLSAESPD